MSLVVACWLTSAVLGMQAPAAPDVQIVLIADTEDEKIGDSCLEDLKHLRHLFAPERWPSGCRVHVEEFAGKKAGRNNFDSTSVRRHLETMPLGRKTRVVIYFCGHGSFGQSEGHQMVFRDASVADEQLIRLLANRADRDPLPLVVVVADSCANRRRDRFPDDREATPATPRESKNLSKKLQQLFLETGGVVHLNSSAEDTSAWGDSSGGFFTSSLVESLEDDAEPVSRSWRKLLRDIGRRTNDRFKKGRQRARADGREVPRQDQQWPQPYCLPFLDDKVDPRPTFGRIGVEFSKKPDPLGVVLDKVDPGTPAGLAKLERGDTVVSINGMTTRTFRDALATLEFFAPEPDVKLVILRESRRMDIVVKRKPLP